MEKDAMWRKGWKVLQKMPDGTFRSACVRGRCSVEYGSGGSLGIASHPGEGCGPLCVFRRYRDAAEFAGWLYSRDLGLVYRPHVAPCEYTPAKARSVWHPMESGDPVMPVPGFRLWAMTVLAAKVRLVGEPCKWMPVRLAACAESGKAAGRGLYDYVLITYRGEEINREACFIFHTDKPVDLARGSCGNDDVPFAVGSNQAVFDIESAPYIPPDK
ncbi:MAG: hypothetical protein WAX69_22255 [Victivallales bacterium]